MKAKDLGEPRKSTTTGVEVQVLRDNGEVKFPTDTYVAKVSENKRVGERVTAVYAAPGGVSHYHFSTDQSLTCFFHLSFQL